MDSVVLYWKNSNFLSVAFKISVSAFDWLFDPYFHFQSVRCCETAFTACSLLCSEAGTRRATARAMLLLSGESHRKHSGPHDFEGSMLQDLRPHGCTRAFVVDDI
jgi:hypothetical protein